MIVCTYAQYRQHRISMGNFGGFRSEPRPLPASLDLSGVDSRPIIDIARGRGCLVCRMLDDGIRSHYARAASSSIVLLRLWPQKELAKEMASNWEDEMEALPGPYTGRFLLSFIMVDQKADHDESPKLEPRYLEIELSYTSLYHGLEDVKLWDRRFVNTENIKSWLLDCKEHHDMCGQNPFCPRVIPPGFRLIDVSRECVVEPQEPVDDYVALSYQWSTATADKKRDIMLLRGNLKDLRAPGFLSADRLPEVVQDAMQFCRDIGQRYLWVDRLCIFQDPEDEDGSRRCQVEEMDAIYWLATLTLVACAEGIGAGLPGASSRPRLKNTNGQEWWFGDFSLIQYFDSPTENDVVRPTSWDSRGWTFQECWISRRRIFFGNSHALIDCSSFDKGEASLCRKWHIQEEHSRLPSQDVRKLTIMERNGFMNSVEHYRTAVQDYTSRTLGWAEDSLLAFLGVSKFIDEKLETTSLSGLPKKHLFTNLMWFRRGLQSPDTEGCILANIPSWSWASGLGRVYHFGWVNSQVGNLVRFWHSENGTVSEVAEATCWFDGRENMTVSTNDDIRVDKELQRFQLDTDMVDNTLKVWNPKTWETGPHSLSEAVNHRQITDESRTLALLSPGCLVFNTTEAVVRMRVRDATSLLPDDDLDLGSEDDETKSFDLVSDEGVKIGATTRERFPDHHKLSLATNEEFKCYAIVIGACVIPGYSISTTFRFVRNGVLEPRRGPAWHLLVMLVERTGHLSSRLAVGMVHAGLWEKANPTWQTIFLV